MMKRRLSRLSDPPHTTPQTTIPDSPTGPPVRPPEAFRAQGIVGLVVFLPPLRASEAGSSYFLRNRPPFPARLPFPPFPSLPRPRTFFFFLSHRAFETSRDAGAPGGGKPRENAAARAAISARSPAPSFLLLVPPPPGPRRRVALGPSAQGWRGMRAARRGGGRPGTAARARPRAVGVREGGPGGPRGGGVAREML